MNDGFWCHHKIWIAGSVSMVMHGAVATALLTQQSEATLIESESPFEMVVLVDSNLKDSVPSEGVGSQQPEKSPEPEKIEEPQPRPEPEPKPELPPQIEAVQEIEPVANSLPEPEPEPEPEPVEEAKQAERVEGDSSPASAADAYVEAVHQAPTLHNRKPRYPLKARRKGMEGVVHLAVEVSAQGNPESISIMTSSGHRLLDREAKRTVSKWKFHPATRGGQPVSSTLEVPIRFRLKNYLNP